MSDARIKSVLGAKHTHNGVNYIAVNAPSPGCLGCAFFREASGGCTETKECAPEQTIWLTQQNYIIHRLKS